ncbi:morphogenetic protein [Citrobacter freundii]|uniref:morphogenetic protein n=1 Tax=Citrobacter freundii TaxID=546 RepID=UPI000EF1B0AE|nr:morphogenetic protein [Citrobacter freundii]AYL42287.1 morphogenetic protein [Citrobacter freundii]
MTERPMIFNGGMVRAILDGRKTQTRRPIKFPFKDRNLGCELSGNELAGELSSGNYLNSPFGKPCDRIWVRETWQAIHEELNDDGYVDETTYSPAIPKKVDNYWHPVYAADNWCEDREQRGFPWRPAIHQPRWASRILLEITNVGVQRLQDISSGDAVREGICQLPASGRYCINHGDQYFGGVSHCAKEVYSWLWQSIYGADSWQANPWVWVIEFKRIGEKS